MLSYHISASKWCGYLKGVIPFWSTLEVKGFVSSQDNVVLNNWAVCNVNWPCQRVSKLTFQALAFHQSKYIRRTKAHNVSFETLNSGPSTLSMELIKPKYHVIFSHQCSNTILNSFSFIWLKEKHCQRNMIISVNKK